MIKGRLGSFDWILVGALAILAAASLVSLASSNRIFFSRQLVWYVISFAIIFLGSQLDWRWVTAQPWFRFGLYGFTIILLIISNLQSSTIRGTRSWLAIGGFQFEPAELAKLALIILFAHFFSRRHIAAWQGKNIFITGAYALPLVGLIAVHPDFGSAFVVLILWLGFLIVSGINKKRFAIGLVLLTIVSIFAWSFFLKPYQRDRVISFLNPSRDPLGANYNVIQSKIAIGSAGLLGKGFQGGTQTQLNFLPETQSDFLFAAFVEEWGIIGGILVVLTFLVVVYRILKIGEGARDNYAKLVALGTGVLFITHFFINVGSNVGLVPVAGIPFPFLSYGGSSLLTVAALISIIEHIKLESSA